MGKELSYRAEAAAEYDRAFSHVSAHFLPFLLRTARLAPGQRVLDVATGTGSASWVQPARCLLLTCRPRWWRGRASASVSRPMRPLRMGRRSRSRMRVSTLYCAALALCFSLIRRRALAGFHRVLRLGGRTTVSVLTSPERSYNGRINVIVARHMPNLAQATARTFALGDAARLQLLFVEAGFRDIETGTEEHSFVLPSFDAYYGPFERGGGSTGQALASLPGATRRAVREEMRQALDDTGGPVEIEVEIRIASGRR